MKETVFEAYARMCNSFNSCENGCPMYQCDWGCIYRGSCQQFVVENAKKAEEIITKWAEEHPIKTRQDVYLQLFPKALVDEDGTLKTKPCFINRKMYYTCTNKKECEICRKNYWREETK